MTSPSPASGAPMMLIPSGNSSCSLCERITRKWPPSSHSNVMLPGTAASTIFISALNHTSVARVLFILALAPVLAALLARVTLGEAITPRTVVAMALALAGDRGLHGGPGGGG